MKILHYRNIGFPKTGTTWLHTQFLYHPNIDCKPNLNDKEYVGNTKEEYIKKYEKYDISYIDTNKPTKICETCYKLFTTGRGGDAFTLHIAGKDITYQRHYMQKRFVVYNKYSIKS